MIDLPAPFRLAKKASKKSTMCPKVGAVMMYGKTVRVGYNKEKTHPEYANPEKHVRKSIHAELDCLLKEPMFRYTEIYVYRELYGLPAMARPCEHCMEFLKSTGVKRIFYTIPHEPYWEEEKL